MALPRITWTAGGQTHTIDLPEDVSMKVEEPETLAIRNLLHLGDLETLVQRTELRGEIVWERPTSSGAADLDVKRQFRQLSAWAQAGELFNVARDNANTVDTTVATTAVSAGDLTVTVASSSGLAAADHIVIRDKVHLEVHKIAAGGISGNVLTLEERILFDYAIGARVRHDEYWPCRLPRDLRTPIVEEEPPVHFNIRLPFVEEVNSL